jgi:periplasmic divalent cation tolerance protein
MMKKYCMVLTTTNSEVNKQAIINQVLERKLAACIQTMKIESHYLWKGEICHDQEELLVMKTKIRCYAELEQVVAKYHAYDTPQIVQVPITEGFNPYLSWLEENTRC